MTVTERISELKKKNDAVILAHNYQLPEVQDAADFVGDSLELSRLAAGSPARTIIFCGVHFMAETAKIISPQKKVILPDLRSGCPLADMVTAGDVRKLRAEHPGAAVVCYINTPALVKAECDICCTSSNAVEVVESLAADKVIFVPDRNLGAYVAARTKKKMVLWNGFCPTHERLSREDVLELKREFPRAKFLAHPECRAEVLALADKIASTSGIIRHVKSDPADTFIIGTEVALLHRLKKDNPSKYFIAASKSMYCPNMKFNTLELLLKALEAGAPEIDVPAEVVRKAGLCIKKMMELKASK